MVVQVKDGDAPLLLDGKVVIQKGEAAVYPIWWADTATQKLTNMFKEITAEVHDVIRNLPQEGFLSAVLEK
eukprot:6232927-Alexandrium_andersonii.AAC.1